MKSVFWFIRLLVFVPLAAQAQLIFHEEFAYSDGPIFTASQGIWTNFNQTVGAFRIASEKASIQSRGEDVSRVISAEGITDGYIYASMVVNFSTLPSGLGSYFFHYKDVGNIGTNLNTRSRIFAVTNGAAPGRFRLGIANIGNFSTSVPTDLRLATNYTLVVRYDILANENTTLWIDPVNESSTLRRAVAADARFPIPITAVALRQDTGLGVLTLDDLKVGRTFLDVYTPSPTGSNPPSISLIPDQTLAGNSATTNIDFLVHDGESLAETLTLTAGSSNPALVPLSGVVFGGAGSNRTVQVIPAVGMQGRADISVTVTDADGNSASSAFLVTVGSPTILPIIGQVMPVNGTRLVVHFTVTDPEDDPQTLTVTGISSTPTLVPDDYLIFSGEGNNRILRVTPAADQTGYTTISLTVSDGFTSNSTSFVLTVHRVEGIVLSEPFEYPDGPLGATGRWLRDGGGTNELMVVNGKISLVATNTEDLHTALDGNAPYGTDEGWVLYAHLRVALTELPASGPGDYFAHFNQGSLRGRVFVGTDEAAPGKFRFGIANGSIRANVLFPQDCDLNVVYTLVLRYDVGQAQTTLWIDPVSEHSANVTATDPISSQAIESFSVRQNPDQGFLFLDDLGIGTSFADALYYTLTIPPAISPIARQRISRDSATTNINFTVRDGQSAAETLIVSGGSSNLDLVPLLGVVFAGTASDRTVQVTPQAGMQGQTEISITVIDGDGNSATNTFLVTVGSPTIGPVPKQFTPVNGGAVEVSFSVSDVEDDPGTLVVTGTSSNPLLVPHENLVFSGTGSDRTLRLTPAADQTGFTIITLTVSDGYSTDSISFVLTVHPVDGYALSEPFEYPDGPLGTTGRWLQHGGGTNELMVVDGKISLAATNTEDLHTALGGSAPYGTNEGWVLYAHLRVALTELPASGAGDYFAHFNEVNEIFRLEPRGRLFVGTDAAASGKFRFGIANGSIQANVLFPQDCELNVVYTLVLRYDVGQAQTTLWIDPVSEHSANVTATDSISPQAIESFSVRQSSDQGSLFLDDLGIGTSFADALYYRLTIPPVISPIAHQRISRDSATTNINFTVRDELSAAETLIVAGGSSNLVLVPLSGVVFGGTAGDRTVQVTPEAGMQGQTEIAITVTDGDGNSATNTFLLIVGSPTIGQVPNQFTPVNGGAVEVSFSVSDVEEAPEALVVIGTSSNPLLVPDESLIFGGTGSERTLQLTPAADGTGYTIITLTVSDGYSTDSISFVLTVYPMEGLVLSEPFEYPDGPLGTTGRWLQHGGGTNELMVVNGKVSLVATNTEDLHTALGGSAPYGTNEGWVLYAHLQVALAELPANGAGDYFAHFNEGHDIDQLAPRGRLFVVTDGAAPGKFRFGIANGSTRANVLFPEDCDLNVVYTLILRYDVGQAQTALWINPEDEHSAMVNALDPISPQPIESFSFRQNPDQGSLWLDDLRIGTAFTDVVRFRLTLVQTEGILQLSWPSSASEAGSVLQSSIGSTDDWADHPDQGAVIGNRRVVDINGVDASAFFRLRKP